MTEWPHAVEQTATDDVRTLLDRGMRALTTDGDLWASRKWFDIAYGVAQRAGDGDAMAAAVVGLGGLWVHEQRTAAGAVLLARLRDAAASVDPTSSLGLQVRARLAAETDYRAGGHAAIMAVLDEAGRAGDPVARAAALSLAHHCVLGPGHGATRQALAVELIGQSARTGRRADLLMGVLWQTVDLLLDGDRHAGRRLGELRGLLAAGRHLAIGFVVDAIDVMLAIRAGRLADAETMAQACLERGMAAGDVDALGWHAGHMIALHWYRGRLPELLPLLTELADSPTLSIVDNSLFAAIAVAAAQAGDRRTAAGALARLRGGDLAALPRSSNWLVTMNGVVEAAHLLDDTDTSAQAYDLLLPYAHLPMMASLGVVCFGSVRHALGVAALTTDRLDAAVDQFAGAVHDNLALGNWPALITSRCRYAQALRRRGRGDDLAAARRALASAEREAAALDIPLPTHGDGRAPVTTCTRSGQRWRVQHGHRSVLVRHSVGMLHLAVLLANPDQDVPSVELAAGAGAVRHAPSGTAQPVLDATAVRDYRNRIERLRDEIGTSDSARAEHDWLVAELAAATGIHGRPRNFPDDAERARIAVGKAIRRAIATVAAADAGIGEHLRLSVHTGTHCSYRPHGTEWNAHSV
jgi:hypothetical protein